MVAPIRGTFREALECAWQGHRFGSEGDGKESRRRSKHHTLRGVAIPPPSQSSGLATALQSAEHETCAKPLPPSQQGIVATYTSGHANASANPRIAAESSSAFPLTMP